MKSSIAKIFVTLFVCVCFLGCKKETKNVSQFLVSGENSTIDYKDRFKYLIEYRVDSLSFPRSASRNEIIKKVPSKDWTSGFFPGSLWKIYELTGDETYLEKAKEWTAFIEKEKLNDGTHDIGFKVFCSFGNGFKITQNEDYKKTIIHSANTLKSRYNTTVGSIRSWDFSKEEWQFPVIIDNMMNLELLFEASIMSSDTTLRDVAYQHAKTTLKNQFREDGSANHVVDYDTITGAVRSKVTHQGFSNESTWARGQSWGVYGFTMTYRYTKDPLFLSQAKKTADFIINHVRFPEDGVPYWDFDAPKIPNEPRDASAAAVLASALIELYEHTKDQKYLDVSDKIVQSLLSKNYVLTSEHKIPFILDHSTGNWPKNDEIDGPINYADYYLLESVLKRKKLSK